MIEIALVGNPNSGKTSLFNALTGLRFKTANYPGVTVEKKVGTLTLPSGVDVALLDLPGTYSLLPRSPDEQVVHDVIFGLQKGTPQPSLVVIVADANSLVRNLYLATQVIETGLPAILALNMWDLAAANGVQIDLKKLESFLGIPCVTSVAVHKKGVDALKQLMDQQVNRVLPAAAKSFQLQFSEPVEKELSYLEQLIRDEHLKTQGMQRLEALCLLADDHSQGQFGGRSHGPDLESHIQLSRKRLEEQGIDWAGVETEARYDKIERICAQVISQESLKRNTFSDQLDRVLTHRIWGLLFFMFFMGIVFQSIFSWASGPMDLIAQLMEKLSAIAGTVLPDGKLQSLVVDGVIAGVGNVVIFLPQIFLLFFFIGLAEDFGYMARAAFVLDRIMRKVGLSGKSFLPLISSFACAIPAIMATRTISDRNERFATIFAAPLMSCSARLPVYTLMIGAFIPSMSVLGAFDLKGLTLFCMYFLSIVASLTVAALFRKTLLKGVQAPYVFELPPYRFPNFKTVLIGVWDRAKEFLYRAGTIIFAISIILWFLSSYPVNTERAKSFELRRQVVSTQFPASEREAIIDGIDREEAGENMRSSYSGMLGKVIEPVIAPLGFDWKIGVGLIASFAAREVLVSSLAIVYNVGAEATESSPDLIYVLQNEISPVTGKPLYTPLTAVSLMVFFVLACQCMSTLAIVKRETNSWRWPLFMFVYMTLLAYGGAFLVYQGGKLLGFE